MMINCISRARSGELKSILYLFVVYLTTLSLLVYCKCSCISECSDPVNLVHSILLDFSNVNPRILIADKSTKLVVNLHVKLDEISEEKIQEEIGGEGVHSVVCDSL